MGSYSGDAPNERWKAIVAVVAVHIGLAFIILNGLSGGRIVHAAVEQLKVFDVAPPPPPPPPPPPRPAPKPEKARKPEGAPAPKAEPTRVVAPPAPRPSPIPAAKVAGTGSSSASGGASAGNGTGAGQSGNGAGGGGPDYSRFTPAQLIRNLTKADYRSVTAGMLPFGSADAAITISGSGSISRCQLTRSSGNPAVDARLCPLMQQRLFFRPALDDHGRPVDYRTNYHANWRP